MSTLADAPADGTPMEPGFLVVGIGASAGGIEALQRFFAHLPADMGCAYVVILHLSPTHESQLASVLQAAAPIPVMQVTERVLVMPNHVYVVPPNQHLLMVDRYLDVSPNLLPEARRAPIDIFFRTLAESHNERGVCVILSGTGADGSMGLKRVKERGGIVFVQHPREAAFDDMPRNALATNLVDDALPVAAMPERIQAYRDSLHTTIIPLEPEQRPEAQQQALREVFTQLRVRTGHDFSQYKRATLLRRIERRINVRGLPNLQAYAALLHDNLDEVQALLKDLLISVTNFFRDGAAFAAVEHDILPRVFQKQGGKHVRIWVVGCATGEEAYSIAMLCAERTLGMIGAPEVQIFATDIDEAALAHARNGLYSASDVADVSPERLRRFFTEEGMRYRVRRELREMVLFANHNVLKDPPFGRLDMATCRNVLIYLNHTAQERVMETLHFALNDGGYLFLGSSESVDRVGHLYALVSREHHIFQSRPTGAGMVPVPDVAPIMQLKQPHPALVAAEPDEHVRQHIGYGELHQRLLEQYAPPSLVVNADYEVVHLSERAGRYLQIAGGEPSNNILKLIRPELRLELRNALYQAVQRQVNVDTNNLPVRIDDRTELVTLRVRPVLHPDDGARGALLVLFEPAVQQPPDAVAVVRAEAPLTQQLEAEVMRLKLQLRTTSEQYEFQTEELRATNEELQALNEELRSSAEELETSKEELQSVNEELRTVNQELKVKIEETTLHSTNLQNLVNSTDIGTIFLDRGFRVRLFTPAARTLFNLIPADNGRPLSDITDRLVDVDVLADADTVLATLRTVEREVRTIDGRAFVLRVLPYRAAEDRIGGVVITFFDITERKQAEEALRVSEERQAFLLKLSDAVRPLIAPIDIQHVVTHTTLQYFGADRCYYCEIEDGRAIIYRDAAREGLPSVAGVYPFHSFPILKAVVEAGQPFVVNDVHTTDTVDEDLRQLCIQLQVISYINVPIIKHNKLVGILCIVQSAPRGWTALEVELVVEAAERSWAAVERAQAEAALRESEVRRHLALEAAAMGTFLYHPMEDRGEPDARMLALFGLHANDSLNLAVALSNVIHPDDHARYADAVARAVDPSGNGKLYAEIRVVHPDETLHWLVVTAQTVFEGEPPLPVRMYGTAANITERKRREANLAFLAEVSQDLVYLTNIDETMEAIGAKIGAYFHVARVIFAEISADQATGRVSHEWHKPNLPDMKASYAAKDYFSPEFERLHRAGKIAIVRDTANDERVDGVRYAALGVGAFVGVPLIHQNKWCFYFSLLDVKPHDWRDDEIELMRELTTRIWTRLERARAEAALRESEARLRVLTEHLPGGAVFIVDHNLRYLLAKGESLRLAGLRSEDVTGKTIFEALPPELAAEYETIYRRGLAGEKFEFEHNAHGRSYISRGIPLQSNTGEVYAVLAVSYDITERKQAEEQLRESQRFVQGMITSLPLAIYIFDFQARKNLFLSPQVLSLFGYTVEELRASGSDLMTTFFHPDDLPLVDAYFEAIGASREDRIFEIDCRLKHKQHGWIWVTCRDIVYRRAADGTPTQLLGTAEDITERKQAAEALQRANEALEARVAERTAALTAANSALQAQITERIKIEAQRGLLLQRIITAQEDERQRIARELHDSLGQFLSALSIRLALVAELPTLPSTAQAEINSLRTITTQLDGEVDRLTMQLRPPTLDDIGLVDALTSYGREWTATSGVPIDVLPINIDAARLPPVVEATVYRIVQEALTNVFKHANATQVSVIVERRGEQLRVIVEDDGQGFDPEGVADQGKGGRRVGLVGMRERATLAGGELAIESAPGNGTTIYLQLPLSYDEPTS